MDLHSVQTYLRPQHPQDITTWDDGWAWLAGGTWIFSEPQPQLTTLVDMEQLGWDELEASAEGVTIGATCTMTQLLSFDYPAQWSGFKALHRAVHELASFKVQNMATIAGNLCLALPASTFAPVMVLLDADYEIHPLSGNAYRIAAADFQTGAKQTILKPGDVLRYIRIPAHALEWTVSYRRICVATAGIAVSIVVVALNQQTGEIRAAIGACIPVPRVLTFAQAPSRDEILEAIAHHISADLFFDDETAGADYRRHVTAVLMERSLTEICQA